MEQTYPESVTIDRKEWLKKSSSLWKGANEGIQKRKKGKNKRFLSSLLVNAPTIHIEEDISLYLKAGEAFRICEKWIDAGKAYGQAAAMKAYELQAIDEAAILYTVAGFCTERLGIGEGEFYFKRAVSLYTETGEYGLAGRIQFWIACNQDQLKNYDQALDDYQASSKYYSAHGMSEQSMICKRRQARLFGIVGNFVNGSTLFKDIGMHELKSNLLKYNAHESFFASALLLLADEIPNCDGTRNFLKEIISMDRRFEISPHVDFLYNVFEIIKNGTIHDFVDHVYDFDHAQNLDELSIFILEKVQSCVKQ